jgi:N-acetyl-anhydromuramyl-L-alanine amidase AmpD
MNGTNSHAHIDNSASCNPRNISPGRSSVVGTLVHTSAGISSLNWLLTGSAEAGRPASADYLIDRDGTRHQICPKGYYPYHAGRSRYNVYGRPLEGDQLSAALFGVELENLDNQLVTFEQVDSLAELVVLLGLDNDWRWPYYLLGHYEIARPLGRRSDPQGFNWGDFMGRLYARARDSNIPGL